MDHFMEEVVVKKNRVAQELLYYIANIIMVLSAVLGFMMLQWIFTGFSVTLLINLVLLIGLAVLLFLYKDRLRTEYEYTFTNGELDFAQVYNNKKRKNLGTMRVKNVDSFGPVESDHFRRIISTPGAKAKNWFLNRGAKLYYFYYVKDANKNIIVFEPSEELVEFVKKYLPRGVYNE
jgi:membrane protein YdbS with pleckstrin-like domain